MFQTIEGKKKRLWFSPFVGKPFAYRLWVCFIDCWFMLGVSIACRSYVFNGAYNFRIFDVAKTNFSNPNNFKISPNHILIWGRIIQGCYSSILQCQISPNNNHYIKNTYLSSYYLMGLIYYSLKSLAYSLKMDQ